MDASTNPSLTDQQRSSSSKPFAELDDTALEAAARDAQTTAESLAATATEAERAATEAAAAYDNKRTKAGFVDREVASDVARDARAAASDAQTRAAALSRECTRRKQLRRSAELEPDADLDTLIERLQAIARKQIPAALAPLAELGRAIMAGIDTRNRAVLELATLSSALGVPAPLGMRDQSSVESILQRMSTWIEQEFGQSRSAHLPSGEYVGQDPPQFLLQACGRALTANEFALHARVAARWSSSQPHTPETSK